MTQEQPEPQPQLCGVDGCERIVNASSPMHYASDRCTSAKSIHCTCDTCY